LATHQGLWRADFSVCLALWRVAFVLVWDIVSDVFSCASILRSAFSPVVAGAERELPLFVELSNDLVISLAGGVGKFRSSNFNLAPRWALLMNSCFNFSSLSQHQTAHK
jgi:hypothetical protein